MTDDDLDRHLRDIQIKNEEIVAQRVPCDDGLEFRSRTYDVQEPHREWYESRIAELEAENATLRAALAGLRAQVNYDLHDQLPAWNAAIRAADNALATTPKEPV